MFPLRPPDPEVQALLAEDARHVHYDIERGLRRHQELLARGAPVPTWADALPAPRSASALLRFWWLGAFAVGALLYLGVRPTAHVAPPAAHVDVSTQSAPRPTPTVEPLRAPIVQQLSHAEQTPQRDTTQRPVDAPANSAVADEGAPRLDADAREDSAAPTHHAARKSSKAVGASPASSTEGVRGDDVSIGRRPEASDPRAEAEMRQLSEAEQRLPADPLQTLKLVRAGELEFQNGYFTEERRYLEIMALYALGRRDEAAARAEWFLRDYPGGAYRRKVQLAQQRHAH